MSDPTLRNWINNDDYWEWVGRQTDEGVIADSLKQMMQDVGFDQVTYTNLTGGIVALHKGFKF